MFGWKRLISSANVATEPFVKRFWNHDFMLVDLYSHVLVLSFFHRSHRTLLKLSRKRYRCAELLTIFLFRTLVPQFWKNHNRRMKKRKIPFSAHKKDGSLGLVATLRKKCADLIVQSEETDGSFNLLLDFIHMMMFIRINTLIWTFLYRH